MSWTQKPKAKGGFGDLRKDGASAASAILSLSRRFQGYGIDHFPPPSPLCTGHRCTFPCGGGVSGPPCFRMIATAACPWKLQNGAFNDLARIP